MDKPFPASVFPRGHALATEGPLSLAQDVSGRSVSTAFGSRNHILSGFDLMLLSSTLYKIVHVQKISFVAISVQLAQGKNDPYRGREQTCARPPAQIPACGLTHGAPASDDDEMRP